MDMFLRATNWSSTAKRMIIVSSAYWIIGKSGSCDGIGSVKTPLASISLTTVWRRAAPMTNKSGERGSPCLTPHLHLNYLPGTTLRRTDYDLEEIISLIQAIHFATKPLCWRICKIRSCSTETKTSTKSIFKMMIGLLDYLRWCIYTKAQSKQSCMALLFKNPYFLVDALKNDLLKPICQELSEEL